MSTTIQIKRSSTASGVPLATDLAVGELAVNLADKRLFTKQSDGTIIELSTNPTDLDAATLRIDGVEITASAAELNKLDGFTGSTAELNLLDGLTATTVELNTLDGITASTAELNKLDGYTGSTAELNILDGITATTAEINKLDGFTGTVDDLNYAKDLRATGVTTAELDVLDGITATTTELNYTDGVTSNIQTQLDAMVEKSGDTMTGDLSLGDNVYAKFGASNDLQIYHDGAHSYIKDTGTGDLRINASNLRIMNADATKYHMYAVDGDYVKLYHNGSAKLSTTSTGVDVTGNVSLGDNGKATFGAGDDLQIYHDGSNSFITDEGTGSLYIRGSSQVRVETPTGENMAIFNDNGGVSLRYDNSKKFETTSTGVDVTGTVTADSLTVQTAQGNINVRSDASAVDFLRDGTNYFRATGASGDFRFTTGNGGYGNVALSIDDNNDVYFFEDTGTTAKMVWDASAEGLELSSLTSYVVTNSGKAVGGLDIKGAYSGLNTYGAGISLGTGGTGRSAIAAVAQHASDNDANGLAFFIHGSSGSTADSSEAMRIDSSGNVGIGTASPKGPLHVYGLDYSYFTSNVSGVTPNSVTQGIALGWNKSSGGGESIIAHNKGGGSSGGLVFANNDGGVYREDARIDSSGNLRVGNTSTELSTTGGRMLADGRIIAVADSKTCFTARRLTNDGAMANFYNSNGLEVGSIGIDNTDNLYITGNATNHGGVMFGTNEMIPYQGDAITDGTMNIGQSAYRFKDLYLSGGVYLGGTGSANKLDDYETGTWTPVAGAGNISGTSITYMGKYTKVGRLVTVYFRAYTASNNLTVASYQLFSGLPFAVDSMTGTGTVITEDIDQFDRQGFASVGGTSFAISNSGSSSGTTTLEATVSYFTS